MKKLLISLLFISALVSGCGMESPMAMLEHIEKAQAALQKAGGVELVSLNVQNTSMALGATDEKFKDMDEKTKEATAKNLAVTAMDHWTDKWPITEVTVYLSYSEDDRGGTSSYKFKPADLKDAATVESTPMPSGSPSP